jgi:hypothetical protein
LKAVTGATNVTNLHWGGHVPLPAPIENLELDEVDENQTSHHGAKALPSETPTLLQRLTGTLVPVMEHPVEAPSLPIAHNDLNPLNFDLNKPKEGVPLTRGLENGGSRELVLFDPSHGKKSGSQVGPTLPSQPGTTFKVGERMIPLVDGTPPSREGRNIVGHVVGPNPSNAPSGGVSKSGIKRIGLANTCIGRKRVRCEKNLESPKFVSELQTLFATLEYDPVVATAYTAHAPFEPPPANILPSKDELVEGLLDAFNVPQDRRGPLPVLTQVDPKNPPKSLKQAMQSKYAKQWAMAVVDEWLSVIANNTWELVDHKPWMKVIPCKWVFVVKVDERGIPVRFKARLVAGGHRQVEGIDYDETYAPVSRMTTLRILLGVAACKGWIVHQLDIKTAFLHGKADLDIYMRQPPGFEDGNNLVCKLHKTLYGLKQAPRAWYFVLKGVLNELGFNQVSADSSFWVHTSSDIVVFLTSIVDDMMVVSSDESYTLKIVHDILKRLPGTHSGRATYYNGMRITWLDNTREVLITQAAHVEKLYEKFESFIRESNIKQRSLPAKEGLRICKNGSNVNMDSHPLDVSIYKYRELLGSIVYITHGSRPDAIHITNQLAKVANMPMWEHWLIALDLLSFLYHSRFWGIKFGGYDMSSQVTLVTRRIDPYPKKDPPVVGYADANHGTGIDDKRSISGFVIKVLGGPVSWASRTQPLTSASTTESEFRALSECSREALWVAKLLDAFDIPCLPFLIRGDSQGALGAIKNYQYTKHTKHVEIIHDFMKDRFQAGVLDFEYVRGDSNPADIFTKCLGKPKFEEFRTMLGMAELPSHLR